MIRDMWCLFNSFYDYLKFVMGYVRVNFNRRWNPPSEHQKSVFWRWVLHCLPMFIQVNNRNIALLQTVGLDQISTASSVNYCHIYRSKTCHGNMYDNIFLNIISLIVMHFKSTFWWWYSVCYNFLPEDVMTFFYC